MPDAVANTLKRTKPFRSQGEAVMVTLTTTAIGAGMMVEGVLREHGLTGTQYNVLRILRGAPPGGHPRADIIDRLMVPHPDATRLIDRLARRRLVARRRSPRDGRVALHTITAKGRDVLAALDPILDDIHRRVARVLGSADSRTLIRICSKLLEAVKTGRVVREGVPRP